MLTQGMDALTREIVTAHGARVAALFKLRKATRTRLARLAAGRLAAHETWRSLAAAMLEPVATAAGSSARKPAADRVAPLEPAGVATVAPVATGRQGPPAAVAGRADATDMLEPLHRHGHAAPRRRARQERPGERGARPTRG